jgi:hypothetical protein
MFYNIGPRCVDKEKEESYKDKEEEIEKMEN